MLTALKKLFWLLTLPIGPLCAQHIDSVVARQINKYNIEISYILKGTTTTQAIEVYYRLNSDTEFRGPLTALNGDTGTVAPGRHTLFWQPLQEPGIDAIHDALIFKVEVKGLAQTKPHIKLIKEYNANDWKLAFDRIYWENEGDGLIPVEKNDVFGYVDTAGKLKVPLKYRYASKFMDGLACVNDGSRFGFIDKYDKLIIPFTYVKAGNFSSGLAWVYNGFKYGYIDNSGKLIFEYIFDYAHDFNETGGPYGPVAVVGKYATSDNKIKKGIIDRYGNTILNYDYDEIVFERLNRVIYESRIYSNLKCAIVTINGKRGIITLIPDGFKLEANYKEIKISYDGLFIAVKKNDNKWKVFNAKGFEIKNLILDHIETTHVSIYQLWPHLSFIAKLKDKWGVLGNDDSSYDLNFVLKPEYEDITNVSKDYFVLAKRNSKYGIIKIGNNSQETIISFDYNHLRYCTEDFYWEKLYEWKYNINLLYAWKEGKVGVIDEQGKILFDMKYDGCAVYEDSIIVVRIGNKYGLIDWNGTNLTGGLIYDGMNIYSEGLVFVKQGDKWGAIDKQGQVVLDFQFDDAYEFRDSKAKVKKNGKEYFIDYNGREIH